MKIQKIIILKENYSLTKKSLTFYTPNKILINQKGNNIENRVSIVLLKFENLQRLILLILLKYRQIFSSDKEAYYLFD